MDLKRKRGDEGSAPPPPPPSSWPPPAPLGQAPEPPPWEQPPPPPPPSNPPPAAAASSESAPWLAQKEEVGRESKRARKEEAATTPEPKKVQYAAPVIGQYLPVEAVESIIPSARYDDDEGSTATLVEQHLHAAGIGKKKLSAPKKPKVGIRRAANTTWTDPTLEEWPESDFRIFVGDLGNEVSDEVLRRAFSRYASLAKAKVIRDKRTQRTKGYGFISFTDPMDFAKALKEMNGKYIGNRPCKLTKSSWKDRELANAVEKEKKKKTKGFKF